jgi:hypothetical protein
MKIQFKRTGGFAGVKRKYSLDTETLPPRDAEQLLLLVKEAGFFDLPAKFPVPEKGADYFTYTIGIEEEERTHSVEVSEPMLPDSLRPLVQFLAGFQRTR